MRRLALLILVTATAAAGIVAIQPAEAGQYAAGPPKVRRVKVTRDIVFPIVGRTRTVNGFGSCRDNCTREHHGNDILTYGWKGLPVIAAHDGVITEIRDDGEWCNVEVTGEDGWHTRYVHLNNDTPGYDDRKYECIPDGLAYGSSVKAGQLIGWVGDSGNAEHTQPHIHFEIRMPSGLPVDPLASLKAARRIDVRQVGSDDPIETTAQVALYAYPQGAPTVTVMSVDDYYSMMAGGYLPIDLEGPLLLSEWDTVPEATQQALLTLAPSRVEVIGDLWLQDVYDHLVGASDDFGGTMLERVVTEGLEERGRVVENSGSLDQQQEGYDDGMASVIDVANVEQSPPAPFALVLLGDRYELSGEEALAFERLTARVGTMMMDFADPDGEIGNAVFEGIGKSGSRYTLYYPTGDDWERYRAREKPEDAPSYGCFVVEPSALTLETLTFLTSMADAPVMPLWR